MNSGNHHVYDQEYGVLRSWCLTSLDIVKSEFLLLLMPTFVHWWVGHWLEGIALLFVSYHIARTASLTRYVNKCNAVTSAWWDRAVQRKPENSGRPGNVIIARYLIVAIYFWSFSYTSYRTYKKNFDSDHNYLYRHDSIFLLSVSFRRAGDALHADSWGAA